jgi:hypothetical protein
MKIDWNEQHKIRLAKADSSLDFHDVVKILMVRKIIRNSKNRIWLKVYTEFGINENTICDIYVENIKDKSIIVYEIQKEITTKWEKDIKEKYKEFLEKGVYGFNTTDLVVIPLKKLSINLDELNKQLDEYVF